MYTYNTYTIYMNLNQAHYKKVKTIKFNKKPLAQVEPSLKKIIKKIISDNILNDNFFKGVNFY